MISRKGIGESSPCSAMKLQAWIEEERSWTASKALCVTFPLICAVSQSLGNVLVRL